MFEIGFSEILVIMVVALIVIGPERLPKVARTLGLLWGRAQRYVNGVRADIERDMHVEEIRQLRLKMEQEAMSAELAAKQTVQTLDQHVQSLALPTEPPPAIESEPHMQAGGPLSEVQVSKPVSPVQQPFPLDKPPT